MRIVLGLAVTLSLSLPALAQHARVRFIPPDPDSRTPVVVRVSGEWSDSSFPRCAEAVHAESFIRVQLGCRPGGASLPVVSQWSLDVDLGVLRAGTYDIEVREPVPDTTPSGPAVLARATLIVQDAAAPFTVTPNTWFGPPPANIVLKGRALQCDDRCAAPIVRFGGQQATLVETRGDEIVVQPPLGTGTVDVTVERGAVTHRRAEGFHYVNAQEPPRPEFFTPVLFPVMSFAPGALGSLWETDASVHNGNDYVFLTVYGTLFNEACRLCDPPPPPGVDPHRSRTVSASQFGLTTDRGFMLFVPRDAARSLHFGLLVRDLSRQAQALGTEVPVVREEEWHDGAFSILNLPNSGDFRVALRVYSERVPTAIRLRIRPMGEERALVDHVIIAAPPGGEGPQHGAVVIGNLIAAYPQLLGAGALRVELLPLSPADSRIWGFAAVTNNTTQHVTVISPQ